MWVLLRLLTAAIVGILKFLRRRTAIQKRESSGRINWVYSQERNKDRVIATTFGVPFEHPVFFLLSPEGRLDRFFKAVGFTHEMQADDPAFDETVYVACDHPALAPVLQEDAATRAAILSLFDGGARRIYADGAHLLVERRGDELPDRATLAELATVRDALQAVPAEHLQMLRDSFFWRALFMESIAWSAAIYGLPAVVELTVRPFPQYFSWWPVIATGLLAGLGGMVLLVGLSWWLLRGSSRSHRVFTESALALLVGVPLSSIVLVSDLNIALDRSKPVILQPVVQEKYIRITHIKSRDHTHYHVQLKLTEAERGRLPEEIEVASGIYSGVQKGGHLAVTLRHGALGLPWVEDIRPVR